MLFVLSRALSLPFDASDIFIDLNSPMMKRLESESERERRGKSDGGKKIFTEKKNYVGKILYSSIKPLNCRVLFLSSLISSLALFLSSATYNY